MNEWTEVTVSRHINDPAGYVAIDATKKSGAHPEAQIAARNVAGWNDLIWRDEADGNRAGEVIVETAAGAWEFCFTVRKSVGWDPWCKVAWRRRSA